MQGCSFDTTFWRLLIAKDINQPPKCDTVKTRCRQRRSREKGRSDVSTAKAQINLRQRELIRVVNAHISWTMQTAINRTSYQSMTICS